MPRIGEARAAAEPTSQLQREKYDRMLKSAARLASEYPIDQVQMHDVAKTAGIAIGTLYRYFPSKTHLFVGVMASQIDGLQTQQSRTANPSEPPTTAVANMLLRALRALMSRPLLAEAMINSLNVAHVDRVMDVTRIDNTFKAGMLAAARIEEPTESDDRLARLLNQQWFGILQSCLNGHVSVETAESDVVLVCDLLLGDLTSARRWREGQNSAE